MIKKVAYKNGLGGTMEIVRYTGGNLREIEEFTGKKLFAYGNKYNTWISEGNYCNNFAVCRGNYVLKWKEDYFIVMNQNHYEFFMSLCDPVPSSDGTVTLSDTELWGESTETSDIDAEIERSLKNLERNHVKGTNPN